MNTINDWKNVDTAFDLDKPIFDFASSSGRAQWNWRHAVEGVVILGGIGSGKTSGSARCLALKFLLAKIGGLVLTAKADEKEQWEEYCRLTGRTKDLIILEPGGNERFNFMQYESTHGSGQKATDNLIDVLKVAIEAGEQQDAGRSDDQFWKIALDSLITNSIDLCKLAYGEVTVPLLYDVVQSIPRGNKVAQAEEYGKVYNQAFDLARLNIVHKIDAYFATLPTDRQAYISSGQGGDEYELELMDAIPEVRTLKYIDQFFYGFINLSEKTRSVIDFNLSGFLYPFLREPFYSLFCKGNSTLTPEDCLRGKIILINVPVKQYDRVGRNIQILVKYIFQRAMERRNVSVNAKPVFLWADEAQTFIHPRDSEFQATARSSRVATVYISQNTSNIYALMGGGHSGEHRVNSLLGTFGSKLFHANSDIGTLNYGSALIGDAYFEDGSESTTMSDQYSQTKGRSWKFDRAVRPEDIVKLKTGGPLNQFIVEAYLHRQGDPLVKGRNYMRVAFDQRYQP
ncbi:TraM recognition domain-containing protein [Spirosoma sp. RP8]|uniref:TraM recognition domain-containing protein n=1 Tax=Spirosoma liriopis TaxID=2937440 RepID=A0ABT0HJB1_9BACT|nr:TraM recognition domain-containing protein [Spirosoma liriopis]MCK8491753.1 TraM recognition domain-containing protein [Spirosoma liriopis]